MCVGKSAMSENRITQQTSSQDRVKGALTLTAPKRAHWMYEGWNFNSGNYLFTTDTK